MISDTDVKRINQDAKIAIDALGAIAFNDRLHPDYLEEKIDQVQRCIDFMSTFTNE